MGSKNEFLISHDTVNRIRELLSGSGWTLSLDCDGSEDITVSLEGAPVFAPKDSQGNPEPLPWDQSEMARGE